MQVFNTFMKVVKKNLFMAIVYTVIFIILCFAFSGSTTATSSFEDTSLGVTVIDEDNSNASAALTDYITSKHTLVQIENSKDEILDALYYTRTDYVLIIKSGYEEKLLKGETSDLFKSYTSPDPYDSTLVDNDINRYISMLTAVNVGSGDLSEALTKTAEILSEETEVMVEMFTDDKDESLDFPIKTQFYFNFLPYGILGSLISILSTVLIKMNNVEVSNRAHCSSTSSFSQTAQLLFGSVVLVIINWLVFMIAAMIINGGIFTGKCWLAALNSFVFVLVAAGIAILISTLKTNPKSIAMIANILSLGMCFLCGVFVAQSLLDPAILSVAKFLPVYWYVKANDMLMFNTAESLNMNEFMTCIGIEVLFAVALFAVILLLSKTRYQKK